jgi:hypothetical protein
MFACDPTDAGYACSHVKLFACSIPAESRERYCITLEPAKEAVLDYVEVKIQ